MQHELILIATYFFIGIICIPMMLGKCKMNSFYGYRVPLSYKSEQHWDYVNRRSGKQLVILSLLFAIFSYVNYFFIIIPFKVTVYLLPAIYLVSVIECYLSLLKFDREFSK